jgi:hypothetical protein
MGLFDGAGPKARSRYAKKPLGTEGELLLSSMAVQMDEVVSNKPRWSVAGKEDATASTRAPTQPARNQEVVNTEFGKKADWRVSKVSRKQKKSKVRKPKERIEREEKRNAEKKRGDQEAEED